MLVTGMRGAGKTFWWNALQKEDVRELIHKKTNIHGIDKQTRVHSCFGVKSAPDDYPDRDTLKSILCDGIEPRTIWRTVLAWHIAKGNDTFSDENSWRSRIEHVHSRPEQIARLFHESDDRLDQADEMILMLFDALDLCADNWQDVNHLIRGIMQNALDMRPYRRIRVKIFLRSDQMDEKQIADFPDASKILSTSVQLDWPSIELYDLLMKLLSNGEDERMFRDYVPQTDSHQASNQESFLFPEIGMMESRKDYQRRYFHSIACPWMGSNAKRGFPYTWIPNHLSDTEGRVSPRSFLEALRSAADHTANLYPNHEYALHYDGIKKGVQEASRIRVNEIKEDYPWVHDVLEPLGGMMVPCQFEEISDRWIESCVLGKLDETIRKSKVKLPPLHIEEGADGIGRDLESLGIFKRLLGNRINIPDIFRVGYGLGRKGGVKPAR